MGCLHFIFTVRINIDEESKSFLRDVRCAQEKQFSATFSARSDTNFTIRHNVQPAWPDYVIKSRPGHIIK